jgi:hypothetical protein
MITIQKEVEILNVENLDWEDMAKDDAENLYLCQIGKNCNANSDPVECPPRYIYKIHKLSLASLNHPDSLSVTPVTYYFKYPLTGYDVDNCSEDDTVFVNCEAAIWHDDAIYLFTKNIWSKNTNNCGGWINGYSYLFKLSLQEESSMEEPLVAEYIGKYNFKLTPDDITTNYQVTAAALNVDASILAIVTYGRVWQFRNFSGDAFFDGTQMYSLYSNTGLDTITRGYEGIEFMNDHKVTLCVDGVNGRLSGIDLDSIALWVRNTNNTGPGSLRHSVLGMSAGDTIRFTPQVTQDTVTITGSSLTLVRSGVLKSSPFDPVCIESQNEVLFTIPSGVTVTLEGLHLRCTDTDSACVQNDGTLNMTDIMISHVNPLTASIVNTGALKLTGFCQLHSDID